MNYDKLRSRIKTGDLFFTGSVGWLGGLIRLVTQSQISHVGTFIWIENRLFISEATFWGYQLTLASKYKNKKFWYGRSLRAKNDEAKIKDTIFGFLGTRYDFLGMILSPVIDTNSKRQFCSESAATVLGIKFIALKRGIFPLDIANTCDNLQMIN